jgi:hypothetical protein
MVKRVQLRRHDLHAPPLDFKSSPIQKLASHMTSTRTCWVVGCHSYRGVSEVFPGQTLILRGEPSNPHDRNAIAVCITSGRVLGHICRSDALPLADALDRGATCSAEVISKVEKSARICIRVSVDESNAIPRPARTQNDNPAQQTPQGSGCLVCIALRMLGCSSLVSLPQVATSL